MHRFNEQARMAFGFAQEEALRLGHPRIAPEHLLLGILRQDLAVTRILKELGLTLSKAQIRLEDIVGKRDNPNGAIPEMAEITRLCMESAAAEARRLQAIQVEPAHLLLGIIRQAESSSRQIGSGTATTQMLGELEGGLRGVMRRVLETLRTPQPAVPPEAITITLKLEPELHQKLLEQTSNLEQYILELLRATIKP